MKKKNNTVIISKALIICIILSFLAIITKLSWITIKDEVDGMNLTKFANNRNTAKKTLYATRGSIYDRSGELLAKSVNSYTVIAYLNASRTSNPNNPQHVIDPNATAKALAPILNMTTEYILSLLKQPFYQVELGPNGRNISELVKEEIEALDLPGISFIASFKRTYQMGNFASYIIGYAKVNDQGKMIGEMGIESYYNDILTGADGYTEYQKDNYGYQIPNTPSIEKKAISGKDIYLTIDSDIQMYLENAINSISTKEKMTWATISVVEAKTGAIVGSASYPNFNLNNLDMTSYLNPLVSYTFEPGSTMKIYSFLGAMEAGIYDGSGTYKSGTVAVADSVIKDFNGKGWGTITYDEGFAYSSNVAAVNLALKMGGPALKEFYTKIGFGTKTGLTLPGEVKGNINIKYQTEIATAAFGQGITTTPIQNLQALTILANGGVMLKPYIVDKIVDQTTKEVIFQGKRTELGQMVSAANAKQISNLMYDAIYSNKTDAKYYQPNNVTIIGKTGTAQIAVPNGGYLTGEKDYVRSFVGLFPAEDPEYIIYSSFKQYKGTFATIASTVSNVMEEIAKNKNLVDQTNQVKTNKIITLETYLSKEVVTTTKALEKIALTPIVIGQGTKVIAQYPLPKTAVIEGTKVFIITNDQEYIMPQVIGWSASEIATYCKLVGLEYKITGYGKVKETSIPAGTPIDLNSLFLITLGK